MTSHKPDTPQERKKFLKQLAAIIECDYDEDGDLVDWSFEGGRIRLHSSEIEQIFQLYLQARSDAIGEGCKALQAVVDELEPDLYGHDWMRLVSVVDNHIEQLKPAGQEEGQDEQNDSLER